MNLLLDTCALLTLAQGTLPSRARQQLETAGEAFASVVSPWEIGIKSAKGSLSLNEPVDSWFNALTEQYQIRPILLDVQTACAAALLPKIHSDPFDRVLISIAQQRNLTILTSDRIIPTYPGIQTLW